MTPFHVLALLSLQADPTVVTNGIYTSKEGLKMELLGIANPADRKSAPIDALGKPLDAAKRKQFEIYSHEKLNERPWSGRAKNGEVRVFVVFVLSGPPDSTIGIHLVRPFRVSMEGYYPPDAPKGRLKRAVVYSFSVPASSKKASLPLHHPSGGYQVIAKFDPATGKCDDERFSFQVETGSQNAFKMTKGSRTDVTMDLYRGTGLIPAEFRGQDFDLSVTDAPEKPKKDLENFPMELGGAGEVGLEGEKLKVEFFGQFARRPNANRQLVLKARAQRFVTFEFGLPKG